jgi:uncharacterized phiE125 gp8 family phage protein
MAHPEAGGGLKPRLLTAPAGLPVTLELAKAFLRIDGNDDDAVVSALIRAATANLDGTAGVLRRALVTQTWEQPFRSFHSRMRLPLAPVASIAAVKHYDADNALQTVSAADYSLVEDDLGPYLAWSPDALRPDLFDRPDPVVVTFVAGYGAATDVPAAIRQAILLLVAQWFATREPVSATGGAAELPLTVTHLLAPYRRVGL